MTVRFHAEPVGPTGGTTGSGTTRVLGKTKWSRLATVVREAIQNIWDARLGGRQPRASFRLERLGERGGGLRKFTLGGALSGDVPVPAKLRRELERSLRNPEHAVLIVEDRGTIGLRGPVHPEKAPDVDQPTDFLDFIFNVGVPRNQDLGAGTYGFGKSAFYALSRCSTIVVDTLTCDGDRRLIACALTDVFSQGDRQFTGRCWWGRSRPGGQGVEPLVGEEAARWAERLGMPDRGPGESGTSIMILDPDTSCADDCDHGDWDWESEEIVRAILLGFWPKLVPWPDSTTSPMAFSVSAWGRQVPVPDPRVTSPFEHLTTPLNRARHALRTGEVDGPWVQAVTRRTRGRTRTLGWLALAIVPERNAREIAPVLERGRVNPFAGGLAHVACMRPAELVAKYREVKTPGSSEVQVAGVFITSAERDIEQAFAEAEPPAHDDWVYGNLENREHRLMVRMALDKMGKAAHQMIGQQQPPARRTATRLGSLLMEVLGGAVRTKPPVLPPPPRKVRAKVRLASLEERDEGCRVARILVTVVRPRQTGGGSGVRLEARPVYLLEGGGQLETPTPRMIGWYRLDEKSGEHCLSMDATVDLDDSLTEVELRLLLEEAYRFDPRIRVARRPV